eukprot:GHVQ01009182.1.p1 GENE.GHVQ01009182.1~~GHVQ01009182.1.p1  ORF type:complete len:701 (+),score=152.32 GHVQ01009182.1:1890-3992(+)
MMVKSSCNNALSPVILLWWLIILLVIPSPLLSTSSSFLIYSFISPFAYTPSRPQRPKKPITSPKPKLPFPRVGPMLPDESSSSVPHFFDVMRTSTSYHPSTHRSLRCYKHSMSSSTAFNNTRISSSCLEACTRRDGSSSTGNSSSTGSGSSLSSSTGSSTGSSKGSSTGSSNHSSSGSSIFPPILQSRAYYLDSILSYSPSELIHHFFNSPSESKRLKDAVRLTVMGILGSLPKYSIDSIILTTIDKLSLLFYQLQLTGYMLKAADYRLDLAHTFMDSKKPSSPAPSTSHSEIDTMETNDQRGDQGGGSGIDKSITAAGAASKGPPRVALLEGEENTSSSGDMPLIGHMIPPSFSSTHSGGVGSADRSSGPSPPVFHLYPDKQIYPNLGSLHIHKSTNDKDPNVSSATSIIDLGQHIRSLERFVIQHNRSSVGCYNNKLLEDTTVGLHSASLPAQPSSGHTLMHSAGSSERLMGMGLSTELLRYLQRMPDLRGLTESASPPVADAMKVIVAIVLQGTVGRGGREVGGGGGEGEMLVQQSGSTLAQLCLWQVTVGWYLRVLEVRRQLQQMLDFGRQDKGERFYASQKYNHNNNNNERKRFVKILKGVKRASPQHDSTQGRGEGVRKVEERGLEQRGPGADKVDYVQSVSNSWDRQENNLEEGKNVLVNGEDAVDMYDKQIDEQIECGEDTIEEDTSSSSSS